SPTTPGKRQPSAGGEEIPRRHRRSADPLPDRRSPACSTYSAHLSRLGFRTSSGHGVCAHSGGLRSSHSFPGSQMREPTDDRRFHHLIWTDTGPLLYVNDRTNTGSARSHTVCPVKFRVGHKRIAVRRHPPHGP